MEEYMTVQQLSSYLKIPIATIYGWTCGKKIPYLKIGKSLRFQKAEIDKWLSDKKIQPFFN